MCVNQDLHNIKSNQLIPYIFTGIIKGKWKNEVKDLFKNNNIIVDFEKRGFLKINKKNNMLQKSITFYKIFKSFVRNYFFELKFLNDVIKKIFIEKNELQLNDKYIKQILKVFSIKFPKIKKTIVYLPSYNCFENEILLCKMEYDLLNKISGDLNIKTINFKNYIDDKNFRKIFALELNGLHYSDLGYSKLTNIIYEEYLK